MLTVLTCYSDLHSVYMGRIITAWCPVSNEIRAAGIQVPSLGSCRALWVSGCFMIPYVVKGSLPSFPSQGKGLCTVCQTSLTGTGQFSQEGLSLASLLCLHQRIRQKSPFPLQVRSHPLEGVTPFTSELGPCLSGFHLSLSPPSLIFLSFIFVRGNTVLFSPNNKFV